MRADADFMVFVAARWPALVQQAVRLGCPPEQAPEAVTEALGRCRRFWGRASQEENVERLVEHEVAEAVSRRPGTPPEGREQAAVELLVLAPPTLDDLDAAERQRRRQALKRGGWVLALVALGGLGAAVYFATYGGTDEPAPDDLSRVQVTRQENPVPGFFWYADGQLHLDHVVVGVEGLRDLTRLGSGAVYGDKRGRVVYAADDGSLALLGRKDPDVPVAATNETGLAGWYDPGSERVVIAEASTGNIRSETPVSDAPQVIAVDGDTAFLIGRDGARALRSTGETAPFPVSPARLLDVRSRIRVFQKDPAVIQIVQSAFNAVFEVPGQGADLAPDGDTVATRSDSGDVVVYDTRSGARLGGRLGGGSPVPTVALGDRGAVAYVAIAGERAQLRTCFLTDQQCPTVDLVDVDAGAVLAR